jgi:hypothetical protein
VTYTYHISESLGHTTSFHGFIQVALLFAYLCRLQLTAKSFTHVYSRIFEFEKKYFIFHQLHLTIHLLYLGGPIVYTFQAVPPTYFGSLLVDNLVSGIEFGDWSSAKRSFYIGSITLITAAYNVAGRHNQSLYHGCSAFITMRARRSIRRHFQSAILLVGQSTKP